MRDEEAVENTKPAIYGRDREEPVSSTFEGVTGRAGQGSCLRIQAAKGRYGTKTSKVAYGGDGLGGGASPERWGALQSRNAAGPMWPAALGRVLR